MDKEQRHRLRQALQSTSALTYEQAREQLYEVVMAERAGRDVDTLFAAFMQALDTYPELAEEYNQLHKDLDEFLGS